MKKFSSCLAASVIAALAVIAVTKPLGVYMARVFNRERTFMDPVLRPIERLLYRVTGVDENHEMRWTEYAFSMLLFSCVSMLLLYLIERTQQLLPWNPQKFAVFEDHLIYADEVPKMRVFIDKMPLASVQLPLVAKLFPDARVLFARRDPRVW